MWMLKRLTGSKEFEIRLRELRYSAHLLRQSPLTMLGIIISGGVMLLALLAPLIAPYSPNTPDFNAKLLPPTLKHLFGTDQYGFDIFSRILFAYRLDLEIAFAVVIVGAGIGVLLGSFAGYIGGKIDETVMRVTDVFFAVPSLILALAVAAVLGRTFNGLVIALTISWWPSYARLIRGEVLAQKEKLYVDAARAAGAGSVRIVLRHILPNSIYPVLINATLDLGQVILAAAALSFLGFGVQPGTAELGRMVADAAPYVFNYPWVVVFPGLAILIISLGLNLVGDGLRDVLDPRLRR
jgi:peptide/nickel transport system permease protein